MKVIAVTGSVGTGKTFLSKKLSKELNYKYIDVNKIIKKYNISECYDKKRKCKIIDVKKLNKILINEIKSLEKNSIKKDSLLKKSFKKKLIKKKKKELS